MRLSAAMLLVAASACAEMKTIPVAKGPAENALDPAAPAWKAVPAVTLALQRTPLLYPTDAPAALQIAAVEVRILRSQGESIVRLEWADRTENAAKLAKAERAWQEERPVAQSGATNRFSDACAVMVPVGGATDVNPSLQMGDARHPV